MLPNDQQSKSRAGRISGSRRRADHVITWLHRGPLTERDRARIVEALNTAPRLDDDPDGPAGRWVA